jgi:hypothetical protein
MKYSKLSNYTIKKILKNFCIELTAVQTAKIMNINRHTVEFCNIRLAATSYSQVLC